MIFLLLFSLQCKALSWKCDYPSIEGPVSTHVLYKEENADVVKWLESYEYCRAKGDPLVYVDAGQPKCEYSRDICVFANNACILNEERQNDPLQECIALLDENTLSWELDSGRIPVTETNESTESTETDVVDCDMEQNETITIETITIETMQTFTMRTTITETIEGIICGMYPTETTMSETATEQIRTVSIEDSTISAANLGTNTLFLSFIMGVISLF